MKSELPAPQGRYLNSLAGAVYLEQFWWGDLIIEVHKIAKSFKGDFWKEPQLILDNLNFELRPGRLCGFLGANGAGKTTTIKIILKFIRADRGDIIFDPLMGKTWNKIRSHIGYFPERPYFYPHLTGMEFALYIGQLQGLNKKEVKEQMTYWSEKLNIDFALNRKIKDYSKGMLQRLGFAVSIIHRPKFLILDEPLSGLDPIGRKDFKRIMLELHQAGTTIFFSSHIVADVEEICDDIVVLAKGKVVYQGEIENLIESRSDNIFEVITTDTKNFKSLNFINSKKLPGKLMSFTIAEKNKDLFLQDILSQKLEIKMLNPIRPSLEEIVYHSREGDIELS